MFTHLKPHITTALLCFILMLLLTSPVFAQQTKGPVTLQNTYTYSFHSNINTGDYELEVSLPPGYNAADTIHYPILYVLDGNTFMPLLMTMQQFFVTGEESVPIIIVGVGYPVNSLLETMPMRTRDYTPTYDFAFDTMMKNYVHQPVTSGGADKFLQTLSKEIIPFVEHTYKASNDRAIAGHSFGALFGAYTLFHQPQLFNRYLLSSVSLPWDNGSLLKDEQQFLDAAPASLNAKVFVSVGSKEENGMIPLMQQMTAALKAHPLKGLTLVEKIMDNETHASVVPVAFSQGVHALYNSGKE